MTTTTTNVSHRNAALVRDLFEQALNQRHFELLDNMISPDYAGPQGEIGPAAFLKPVAALIKAFPDMRWEIEEIVSEGDKVAARTKWHGTHTDFFSTLAPTGKTISNEGIGTYEVHDGKITAVHLQTDRLGFLQSVGVVPLNPAQLYAKISPSKVSFIDKFVVPPASITAFSERMCINRAFIRTLPGFIEDAAYTHTDERGNMVCVTVAQWAGQDAVNKAKEAVQAEYKRQGFDLQAMLKQWGITIDRGLYTQQPD